MRINNGVMLGKLERSLLTTSNSREAEPKVRRLESNFCTIKFLSQVLHSVAITTKLTEARLSVSFFSFTTPSYLIRQNIPNFHTSSAIFNSILQPTDLKPQMSESWVRKPFLTHTEKGRFNTWKYLVAGGFGQHWWMFLLCLLVSICFYILLSPAFLHCFMSSFSPFIPCLFIRILPFLSVFSVSLVLYDNWSSYSLSTWKWVFQPGRACSLRNQSIRVNETASDENIEERPFEKGCRQVLGLPPCSGPMIVSWHGYSWPSSC